MAVQPLLYDFVGLGSRYLQQVWILQRKYHWQLMMPHTINGVVGHLISPYCQDVHVGNYSLQKVGSMNYGAFMRFYAGLQSIQTTKLAFLAPVDNSVMDFFTGWYHLMIDERGYYYPKNHYTRKIYVSLYDKSGVESVRLELHGAFPTGKPVIDVNFDNDLFRIGVELSVDNVTMHSLIGSIRSAAVNLFDSAVQQTAALLGNSGPIAENGIRTPNGNIEF